MNWLTAKTTLHGVEVAFFFPVSKIERSLVFQKVEEALGTIEAYAPVRFAALRTDLRQILIRGLPDEVSHYDPERQLCEIFVGWIKSDEGTPEAIASKVVHEAEHARLWRLGFRYTPEVQARIERICHRPSVSSVGVCLPELRWWPPPSWEWTSSPSSTQRKHVSIASEKLCAASSLVTPWWYLCCGCTTFGPGYASGVRPLIRVG
jgi:hypothetical protein